MKQMIIALLLLGGIVAMSTTEASAIVCADGVVRTACVGARGAAVVRHPYAGGVHRRVYR